MKQKLKIFIIAGIALVLMMACSSDPTDTPQNIRWYSLDDGLMVAGKLDKKVFVYFWAKW
jgi:hypothetical protein